MLVALQRFYDREVAKRWNNPVTLVISRRRRTRSCTRSIFPFEKLLHRVNSLGYSATWFPVHGRSARLII